MEKNQLRKPADIPRLVGEEKTQQIGNTLYRYSATWINKLESEGHWRLYWKQQELLQTVLGDCDTILEIGVGSGFAANYLRSKGHSITTFDIDPEKNPDVVGNVVTYVFKEKVGHVLAFEVFEHIPYDEFLKVLDKLSRVCTKSLCLSVPIGKREFASFEIGLPKLGTRRFSAKTRKRNLSGSYHFWEIDFADVSKVRFLQDLNEHGFRVDSTQEFAFRLFVSCRPKNVS